MFLTRDCRVARSGAGALSELLAMTDTFMSLTSKYSLIFFSLIAVLLFLTSAQLVLAAEPAPGVNKAQSGLDETANKGGLKTATTETDLPTIIGRVVGAVLVFVGAIFFGLILWSGFGWMLAKGNEEKINEAKETIFGAVLGLMVVLGAYAITKVIALVFTSALTGT